jgi:hypothetical protein
VTALALPQVTRMKRAINEFMLESSLSNFLFALLNNNIHFNHMGRNPGPESFSLGCEFFWQAAQPCT